MTRIFSLLIIQILALAPSICAKDIELNENLSLLDISNDIYFLEDKDCRLTFEEVKAGVEFQPSSGMVNGGVTKSCFWIKIDLHNQSENERYQILLEHPILDVVEYYDESNLLQRIDENNSFYDRLYDDPNFVFDVSIPSGARQTFYLKIKGSELIVIPISIGTPDKILSASTLKEMLFGIYAGIIIVMFLYNLFVFFSVKDQSYLYYVIYILLIGLTQASLKGFTSKYLWPESIFLHHYGVTILSSLSGISAIEFLKVFLHSKELDPKLHRFSYIINGLFIVSIGICLLGQIQTSFSIMQLTTMVGSLYAFVIATRILRTGYRPAKFFLAAWSVLLIGAVIFVLKDFELVPFNIYTNYSLQAASIIEIVLLSFALADRINILRIEKEQSQLEALYALEENERIVREQNIILEARVEERTVALKKANEELNLVLLDLKNAQSQLVSAEKMASLGQLTAGIAHEINNPINYVKSSVKPLKQNITELLELIAKYEENIKAIDDSEVIKKLNAFKQQIQFDYLIEETMDVINNIEEGANRTVEIVRGLRTFSHIDDLGLKMTDLNKGIKSTLKLLGGELPAQLKINMDLGPIREIECFGGKINQVFMNVMNNAIQAIKLKGEASGVLKIKTIEIDGQVQVSIEDNGVGMTQEVKEKIFDPFFTTKDVGEGTGLGLSVVYGIIESHHGKIDVHTELGKGTTFIINLPYIQPK